MSVHVAITRKVHPGKEKEFIEALRRFLGESFLHGGVQGAGIILPAKGGDPHEIGILRTFADEAERDAFYASQLFKDWEAYAETMTDPPVYRELKGLEAWFRSPAAPPRWKMAVLTLCGVFPTSLMLTLCVAPLLQAWPVILRILLIACGMVGLLTWVVMPLIIKVAKPWLRNN